jgi:enamine deaminase RidA (YjgF/YER057c/UK114 family)
MERFQRQLVSSGSPYEEPIGFSRAVRVGDRVVVAGTAPNWPDGHAAGRSHGPYFREARPVSTMIVVSGFIDPRWKVEMEAEAIIG